MPAFEPTFPTFGARGPAGGGRGRAPFRGTSHGAPTSDTRRRGFVRRPLRSPRVSLAVVHPGGNTGRLGVACRNLSCGGMSVLLDSYLFAGTRCVVTLHDPRHGATGVPGTVARCRHVRDRIHEAGIVFDAPVSVGAFVDTDLAGDWFTVERVEPGLLAGRVLCACASRVDGVFIADCLRASRAEVVYAATFGEALTAAGNGCDLVVADLDLAGRSGADLIGELRRGGLWTPVVLLASDLAAALCSGVRESGAGGLLLKPLTSDMILRAAAEFLLVPGADDPLLSTLPRTHPGRAFLPGYLAQLPGLADRLERAARAGHSAECRSICLAVQGSAPAVGLERLAEAGAMAAQAVASAASVETFPGALSVLITMCRAGAAGDDPGRAVQAPGRRSPDPE